MTVRSTNGDKLPPGWRPGQPLTGRNIELRGAEECPFGPECHSCRDGLQWNRVYETHMKPRDR